MGLMDKMKKILFDEDEVEVPISSKELPETKSNVKIEKQGFIDYHHEEEDPIKEVIIPKEEPIVEKKVEETPKSTFNFPMDMDDEPIISRESRYEDQEITKPVQTIGDLERDYDFEAERRNYHIEEPKKKEYVQKDYKKLLSEVSEEKEKKKPFTVTPIISPVYGILDKNYTPDEVKERRENITNSNTNISKRDFSSVGLRDLPMKREEIVVEEPVQEEVVSSKDIMDDLSRINSSINDLISREEPIKEVEIETIEEKEFVSIEDKVNKSVEDAFEETSEFNSISEFDKQKEEDSYLTDFDYNEDDEEATIGDLVEDEEEIIESPSVEEDQSEDIGGYTVETKSSYDEDDENLDATIETDLFNLIDSMYKSDEDEEE